MKISLSWLLDHIKINKKEVDVDALLKKLSSTTSEIDAIESIKIDIASMYVARVVHSSQEGVQCEIPELKKKINMPYRKDCDKGSFYLIKKAKDNFEWVSLSDVGSGKDGLLTNLFFDENQAKGAWRDLFDQEDTIITIDNKALTHRPDLWGHRGFAREMAALLGKELIPEETIYAALPIKNYDFVSKASEEGHFSFELEQQAGCLSTGKRLAGLYLPEISYTPSILWMALRLARVDLRPLDALIDITNYVMHDIGQPMHAFDAAKIASKKIAGRCALSGEKLRLLDGEEVTLESSDYVITDGKIPLAVAGVMGGLEGSVTESTRSLLLESANFDATAIRRTATRLKKRTESSTRFEKSLDPNQNTHALLRYIKLLEDLGISHNIANSVISLGALIQEKKIEIQHSVLESKIGAHILPESVAGILKKLGFGIESRDDTYHVTVPTFRAKDIQLPEDLIEEVARFIGYSSIVSVAPERQMAAFDIQVLMRKRAIKELLAYGLAMHEVQNYAFFDEDFLRILRYDPIDALEVANPQSENWRRLISSLVPNLLKCVVTNQAQRETLRFFELNRVWFVEEHAIEELQCAGVWYEGKKTVDFYEGKALLTKLFERLTLPIKWEKPSGKIDPWYDAYQTAELWLNDRIIGRAGKASLQFTRPILEGDLFIFELDGQILLHEKREATVFKPLSKYPSTDLDMSLLVPVECTVAGLTHAIAQADPRIIDVELVDWFEKEEWKDKKSVTLRFTAYDSDGTLDKESIDAIWNHVSQAVISLGAEIR